MTLTQSNYNFAITLLAVYLRSDTKPGSKEDLEIMRLARIVEDFELERKNTTFEPHYLDATP